MPAKKSAQKQPQYEKELVKEIRELTKEVKKLKKLEFFKVFKHPIKFLWFSLWKGIMIGFGSVLGASVVVAIFVYLVSKISVVPIVGDFVNDIIVEIQSESTIN